MFQILYFRPQSLDGFIVPFPLESRKGLFSAAGALRHIPRKNYRPTVWDKHLFAVFGVYVVAFHLGLFLSSLIFSRWKFRSSRIAPSIAAYTSQTCHECGHIGIRNGKHFRCAHCGNVADADVNAALNIATWGYVNTHERWELLSCPIHDDLSTSKAHKSLACG